MGTPGRRGDDRRLVFVSTYPPTRCGIATFTTSLLRSINSISDDRRSVVVRLLQSDDDRPSEADEVIAEVSTGSDSWARKALSACHPGDVLWIQHEYGIFGPDDGGKVVDLAEMSPVPVAVTLHTVPAHPTSRQRQILESLAAVSTCVVVMSQEARQRLVDTFRVDAGRVRVIAHGARWVANASTHRSHDRPMVLNWGLIGPGKGLEWAIAAMPLLRHLDPLPRLVIRGATHPNVRRRDGETYRRSLERMIDILEIGDMVEIEDDYLSEESLISLLQSADLVLLPYDSKEQVTSGVLVDALGARIPVIATAFPHATEMLAGGAGALVPHGDPTAIARALEHFLTDPAAARLARERARDAGRDLAWPRIASEYLRLAGETLLHEAVGVA